MTQCVIGIRLKIPDNEAYTALATLQRLAVPVATLQRTEVWNFELSGGVEELYEAVRRSEALFNANKHEIVSFEHAAPRSGEVWIEELDVRLDARKLFAGKPVAGVASAHRYVAWRMFAANGEPLERNAVQMASDRLLCNPAIERAIL